MKLHILVTLGLLALLPAATLPSTTGYAQAPSDQIRNERPLPRRPGTLHEPRRLFTNNPAGEAPPRAVPMDPAVLRRRTTRIDSDVLESIRRGRGEAVRFNLFEDTFFDGIIEKTEMRSPDSYSHLGRLVGDDGASFILTVERDVMVAAARSPREGLYHVRFLDGDLYEIVEIDEDKLPPCDVGPGDVAAPAAGDPHGDLASFSQTTADDGSIFDVLVVYTADARDGAGGTTAMEALINQAVDETNFAYTESQITPRLRLAHTNLISYTETGDSSTDLNRLRGKTDGFMDSVHDLRETRGADLVCLIVESMPDACGRAYVMTTLSAGFESYAFSVVKRSCIGSTYVFAHELGHNMGCHHAVGDGDPPTARGDGLYDYSHGWRWTWHGANQYRTIMAYSPGTRVPHFSNPNVFYSGDPTGREDLEDNARSINNAAFTVANWRLAILGDVDGNGIVDGLDLTAVLTAWETIPGDPLWNPAADLDGNGIVDGLDLTAVISNWTTAVAGPPAASEPTATVKPHRRGSHRGNVRRK